MKSLLTFAPATKFERETVVILSDSEPGVAHVWTSQPSRAQQLLRDHPAALVERQTDSAGRTTGLTFTLPIACFKLRRPHIPSERQQASLRRATAVSRIAKTVRKAPQGRRNPGLEAVEAVAMP